MFDASISMKINVSPKLNNAIQIACSIVALNYLHNALYQNLESLQLNSP